ncbi:Oidioi.mRNA.OKI2018_I69.chr2.g5065.t1.cds [Oikopleura dioica]|uniref:Oidioi.mRNA.OKI2018_I69.chr2.g5065.t1.cds n=1 Tax=Oikopleura dioica TaxID=34765 RepID=A0ABN7T5V1_OIKDI|nr:Oidioi.mRNA.OKI2018_I69.chr2.g5065.t1.cds [Oikopleura dioica]
MRALLLVFSVTTASSSLCELVTIECQTDTVNMKINDTCLFEDFAAMNSTITSMFLGTVDLTTGVYDESAVHDDCKVTDAISEGFEI